MFVDKNSGKALNKTHSEFSPLPVSSKETLPEVKTSLFQLQNGTAEADTFKQWMAEQADPQQQAKTILLNTMDPLANSGKNRSLQAAQTLSIEGVIKGLLKLLGMTDASSLFNLQKPSAANNTVTNNSTLPVSSNPPPTQPATEAATDPATGAAVISGTPDSAAIMPASVHSSATVAEALPPPPVAAPAPLGSTTAAAITPAVPALPNPTTASPLPDTTNFIQNSTIQIHDPDAKASSRVSFNAQQGKWIVSWGDRDATGSGLYLTQDPTLGTWVPVFRNTPIGNPPHSTDILLETPAQVNLSTLPTKYPDEIIAPPASRPGPDPVNPGDPGAAVTRFTGELPLPTIQPPTDLFDDTKWFISPDRGFENQPGSNFRGGHFFEVPTKRADGTVIEGYQMDLPATGTVYTLDNSRPNDPPFLVPGWVLRSGDYQYLPNQQGLAPSVKEHNGLLPGSYRITRKQAAGPATVVPADSVPPPPPKNPIKLPRLVAAALDVAVSTDGSSDGDIVKVANGTVGGKPGKLYTNTASDHQLFVPNDSASGLMHRWDVSTPTPTPWHAFQIGPNELNVDPAFQNQGLTATPQWVQKYLGLVSDGGPTPPAVSLDENAKLGGKAGTSWTNPANGRAVFISKEGQSYIRPDANSSYVALNRQDPIITGAPVNATDVPAASRGYWQDPNTKHYYLVDLRDGSLVGRPVKGLPPKELIVTDAQINAMTSKHGVGFDAGQFLKENILQPLLKTGGDAISSVLNPSTLPSVIAANVRKTVDTVKRTTQNITNGNINDITVATNGLVNALATQGIDIARDPVKAMKYLLGLRSNEENQDMLEVFAYSALGKDDAADATVAKNPALLTTVRLLGQLYHGLSSFSPGNALATTIGTAQLDNHGIVEDSELLAAYPADVLNTLGVLGASAGSRAILAAKEAKTVAEGSLAAVKKTAADASTLETQRLDLALKKSTATRELSDLTSQVRDTEFEATSKEAAAAANPGSTVLQAQAQIARSKATAAATAAAQKQAAVDALKAQADTVATNLVTAQRAAQDAVKTHTGVVGQPIITTQNMIDAGKQPDPNTPVSAANQKAGAIGQLLEQQVGKGRLEILDQTADRQILGVEGADLNIVLQDKPFAPGMPTNPNIVEPLYSGGIALEDGTTLYWKRIERTEPILADAGKLLTDGRTYREAIDSATDDIIVNTGKIPANPDTSFGLNKDGKVKLFKTEELRDATNQEILNAQRRQLVQKNLPTPDLADQTHLVGLQNGFNFTTTQDGIHNITHVILGGKKNVSSSAADEAALTYADNLAGDFEDGNIKPGAALQNSLSEAQKIFKANQQALLTGVDDNIDKFLSISPVTPLQASEDLTSLKDYLSREGFFNPGSTPQQTTSALRVQGIVNDIQVAVTAGNYTQARSIADTLRPILKQQYTDAAAIAQTYPKKMITNMRAIELANPTIDPYDLWYTVKTKTNLSSIKMPGEAQLTQAYTEYFGSEPGLDTVLTDFRNNQANLQKLHTEARATAKAGVSEPALPITPGAANSLQANGWSPDMVRDTLEHPAFTSPYTEKTFNPATGQLETTGSYELRFRPDGSYAKVQLAPQTNGTAVAKVVEVSKIGDPDALSALVSANPPVISPDAIAFLNRPASPAIEQAALKKNVLERVLPQNFAFTPQGNMRRQLTQQIGDTVLSGQPLPTVDALVTASQQQLAPLQASITSTVGRGKADLTALLAANPVTDGRIPNAVLQRLSQLQDELIQRGLVSEQDPSALTDAFTQFKQSLASGSPTATAIDTLGTNLTQTLNQGLKPLTPQTAQQLLTDTASMWDLVKRQNNGVIPADLNNLVVRVNQLKNPTDLVLREGANNVRVDSVTPTWARATDGTPTFGQVPAIRTDGPVSLEVGPIHMGQGSPYSGALGIQQNRADLLKRLGFENDPAKAVETVLKGQNPQYYYDPLNNTVELMISNPAAGSNGRDTLKLTMEQRRYTNGTPYYSVMDLSEVAGAAEKKRLTPLSANANPPAAKPATTLQQVIANNIINQNIPTGDGISDVVGGTHDFLAHLGRDGQGTGISITGEIDTLGRDRVIGEVLQSGVADLSTLESPAKVAQLAQNAQDSITLYIDAQKRNIGKMKATDNIDTISKNLDTLGLLNQGPGIQNTSLTNKLAVLLDDLRTAKTMGDPAKVQAAYDAMKNQALSNIETARVAFSTEDVLNLFDDLRAMQRANNSTNVSQLIKDMDNPAKFDTIIVPEELIPPLYQKLPPHEPTASLGQVIRNNLVNQNLPGDLLSGLKGTHDFLAHLGSDSLGTGTSTVGELYAAGRDAAIRQIKTDGSQDIQHFYTPQVMQNLQGIGQNNVENLAINYKTGVDRLTLDNGADDLKQQATSLGLLNTYPGMQNIEQTQALIKMMDDIKTAMTNGNRPQADALLSAFKSNAKTYIDAEKVSFTAEDTQKLINDIQTLMVRNNYTDVQKFLKDLDDPTKYDSLNIPKSMLPTMFKQRRFKEQVRRGG